MTNYRWQWCKPDRPGVWAFGGLMQSAPPSAMPAILRIDTTELRETGWWCFLMPLPEILPPKKKTVWRMWVRHTSDPYQRPDAVWTKADAVTTTETEWKQTSITMETEE